LRPPLALGVEVSKWYERKCEIYFIVSAVLAQQILAGLGKIAGKQLLPNSGAINYSHFTKNKIDTCCTQQTLKWLAYQAFQYEEFFCILALREFE